MPTERQQNSLQKLSSCLEQIEKYDPRALMQVERLGSDLCFAFLFSYFQAIVMSANQLRETDLSLLPLGMLEKLEHGFTQIHSIFISISNFKGAFDNKPKDEATRLGTLLENEWGNIFLDVQLLLNSREISLHSADLANLRSNFSDMKSAIDREELDFKAKLKEADSAFSEFLKQKEDSFEKEKVEKLLLIEKALQEVRKAAAEAGVSQTSIYFHTEANEHQTIAKYWLSASCVLLLMLMAFGLFGTFLFSWIGITQPSPTEPIGWHFQYLVHKGAVFICLIFSLVIAVKNYSASRHNYVVNKHRNNALSTFQAFAASAEDTDTKNAVLIQATKSVFSPQASGYVKTDGDNSPQSPIIEILRAAGGTKP